MGYFVVLVSHFLTLASLSRSTKLFSKQHLVPAANNHHRLCHAYSAMSTLPCQLCPAYPAMSTLPCLPSVFITMMRKATNTQILY